MISTDVRDIFTHRLRKLAQSGLPAHEIAASIQRLMEAERAQKFPLEEEKEDFVHPFFSRQKAHLSVV